MENHIVCEWASFPFHCSRQFTGRPISPGAQQDLIIISSAKGLKCGICRADLGKYKK